MASQKMTPYHYFSVKREGFRNENGKFGCSLFRRGLSERQFNNTQKTQQPEVQGSGGEEHPENDGGGAHIAARAILSAATTLLHPLCLEGENGFLVPGEFLIHRSMQAR